MVMKETITTTTNNLPFQDHLYDNDDDQDREEGDEEEALWSKYSEDEYMKQILQQEEQQKQTSQEGEEEEGRKRKKKSNTTLAAAARESAMSLLSSAKKRNNTSKKDDDDDDEDTLPDAIKLMDTIDVEDRSSSNKQSKKTKKMQTLEKIIQASVNQNKKKQQQQKQQKDSPSKNNIDDLEYDQASLLGELTVDEMIQELEQTEEEILFNILNADQDLEMEYDQDSSLLLSPASQSKKKLSLARAMNPKYKNGTDELSMNQQSMIGEQTVDNILLNMEDDELIEHVEDGTLKSWKHFNPIARSVVSHQQSTTPSALIREAAADMINATMRRRKTYFVDDDTSVGSWTDEIEIVVKEKQSKKKSTGDGNDDGGTLGNQTNINTLVSSLSDTFYGSRNPGQQYQQGLESTKEERLWWVQAGQTPAAHNNNNNNTRTTTPIKSNNIGGGNKGEPKAPPTPSTYNSDFHVKSSSSDDDYPPPPLPSIQTRTRKSFDASTDKLTKNDDGGDDKSYCCHFMVQAIQDNPSIRLLVILAAVGFLIFTGLAVIILVKYDVNESFGLGGGATAVESTTSVDTTATTTENPTDSPFDFDVLIPQTLSPSSTPPGTTSTTSPAFTITSPPVSAPSFPTSPPSSPPPVTSPTTAPVDDYTRIILEVINRRIPETVQALEDPLSPQLQALDWMRSLPPNEEILSQPKRVVQRWVLAVVYYSMAGSTWRNTDGWLTDSNECDWYSTSSDGLCNEEGFVNEIDLRRMDLRGQLPKELIILSESLVSLRVNGNMITGSIPNFLTDLSNLDRLHLNDNLLKGTLGTEIGKLTNLWSLRLGQLESLTGSIPFQVGLLTKLEYLYLDGNELNGTIPMELSKLTSLLHLKLQYNDLSGTVPMELSFLTNLITMELQQNDLIGSVPMEVCTRLGAPIDVSIQVDCGEVSCTCCDGC